VVASIVDFATLTKHLQRDVSLMSPCFASALVQIGYRTHESQVYSTLRWARHETYNRYQGFF